MYLVINYEEDPFIINICSNRDTAEELKEIYDNNFHMDDMDSFIRIEKIEGSGDILWTAYPEDKLKQFVYADSEIIME